MTFALSECAEYDIPLKAMDMIPLIILYYNRKNGVLAG